MKRFLSFLLICLTVTLTAMTSTPNVFADSNKEKKEFKPAVVSQMAKDMCPQGYLSVAETDEAALYADTANATFANLDKKSGKLWYSSPPSAESDTVAGANEKNLIRSLISLTYYDDSNNKATYNSYEHCVRNGLFDYYSIENGIVFEFTLTNRVKGINDIPEFISEERLKKYFYEDATEKEKKILDKRFTKREDGRYQRYNIPTFELKQIFALMERSGYDSAQLEIDRAENKDLYSKSDTEVKPAVQFVIPVEIRLDGADVIFSVDAGKIKKTGGYFISDIVLNSYYGAADTTESGYIFIPDGCGALINLNNKKASQGAASVSVLGADITSAVNSKGATLQYAHLPVYGIKRGEDALFAIMESGSTLATISAITSGNKSSYNTAYFTCNAEQKGEVTLEKKASVNVFESSPYNGLFSVRYKFLQTGKATYSDMASLYRKYLFGENEKLSGDMPLHIQLLGSIDKLKSFLFFEYFDDEILTDYNDAERIVNDLSGEGVANIKLQYSGIFRGGLRHSTALNPKINKSLGSRSELERLNKLLEENGGKLYADVSVVQVYQKGKGFNYSKDAAKYISQNPIQLFKFSPVTKRIQKENSFLKGIPYDFILSPKKIEKAVSKIYSFSEKYGIDGLYIQDLGTKVYGDYNNKASINREKSLDYALAGIKAIGENKDIIANEGNFAVLNYVSAVLNVPDTSSGYYIEDCSVPFYQMVMHGYVDYAPKAINLSDNLENSFLKAIEYGSSLNFCVMSAEASVLKNTAYSEYYATEYAVFRQKIIDYSKELNEALKNCHGAAIIEHSNITDGVYCTKYDNGDSFYVNYTDKKQTVKTENGNIELEKKSYLRVVDN